MRMRETSAHGFAPLRRSQAVLAGDLNDLRLPSGQRVAEVSGGELLRELTRLQIPYVHPGDGKAVLAAAYRRHIQQIGDEASRRAIADWLRGNR